MVEESRYFRIKRQVFSDLELGKLSKDGHYLLSVLLNKAHFDTGEVIASYQGAADLLGCSRKKATAEIKKLKSLSYIDYETSKGKKFTVKLLHYYPVDLNKLKKKEQVKCGEEQAKGQVKLLSNHLNINSEKNMLGNRSSWSNTIESNTNECNEIEDNDPILFFNKPVPEDLINSYPRGEFAIKLASLELEYKSKPPSDPIALLQKSLRKGNKY